MAEEIKNRTFSLSFFFLLPGWLLRTNTDLVGVRDAGLEEEKCN